MIFNSTGSLWQWDSGRVLKITSDKITTNDFIHFQQHWAVWSLHPEMSGGQMVVKIPNQALKQAMTLNVYAYITDGNNNYRTLIREQFEIESRIQPPEYIDDPTPVITYPELVELVEDMRELEEQWSTPVASATSVEYNEPATATVTRSAGNVSFHFEIPKGAPGPGGNWVTSWNRRIGAVMPQTGDYSLSMVGGIPLTNSEIDELWEVN